MQFSFDIVCSQYHCFLLRGATQETPEAFVARVLQFNIQRIAFEVNRSIETLDEAKEALKRIISKSRWTKSSILRRA